LKLVVGQEVLYVSEEVICSDIKYDKEGYLLSLSLSLSDKEGYLIAINTWKRAHKY
jgi:transcriptional antiterminator